MVMMTHLALGETTFNGHQEQRLETRSYSRGDLLFIEGDSAEGAFVLREGRVKLSICSRSGKVTIIRIAEPGEYLGLAAALARTEHDCTSGRLASVE
jgi:CRP-like cAMP-binding protein